MNTTTHNTPRLTEESGQSLLSVTRQSNTSLKLSPVRQILAALIANSVLIHVGFMFTFSAVALPQLEAPTSAIPITPEQASWIASIASFATPTGCLLGGVMMDRFGRRQTLLLLSVPCVLGWLLLGSVGLMVNTYSSLCVPAIYCARVLQGLGTGIISCVTRIYTSEISTPDFRGVLCSFASLVLSLGVLMGYLLGALFTWPVMALLAAIFPLSSSLLVLVFLPETPTWLLQHDDYEGAGRSLRRLRDPKMKDVSAELTVLGGDVDTSKLNKLEVLSQPSTLKPLAMLMFAFLVYQFSGISVLTFYNVHIVERTGAQTNPYVTAVVFGVIRLVCNIGGCFMLRLYDRRKLTILSGVSSGLAMISLGTHGYLTRDVEAHFWLWKYFPILCIVSFYVTFSLGFLLVPWVLVGELFPAKIRGFLAGVTACFAHCILFLAVKTFPFFIENLKFYGAFWFYGSVVSIGAVVLFIILPETRNRTLLEIETLFKSKSSA